MTQKLIGAVLILASCGGFGFYMAACHKREVYCLQKLYHIIELMEWELEYRLTPLPELCRLIAEKTKLYFPSLFHRLADELSYQLAPDVSVCMRNAIAGENTLPSQSAHYLIMLGESLGQYNVDGQLKSLEQLRLLIKQKLDELMDNQTQRLRCYQTLGLCAGSALAILFV